MSPYFKFNESSSRNNISLGKYYRNKLSKNNLLETKDQELNKIIYFSDDNKNLIESAYSYLQGFIPQNYFELIKIESIELKKTLNFHPLNDKNEYLKEVKNNTNCLIIDKFREYILNLFDTENKIFNNIPSNCFDLKSKIIIYFTNQTNFIKYFPLLMRESQFLFEKLKLLNQKTNILEIYLKEKNKIKYETIYLNNVEINNLSSKTLENNLVFHFSN